MKLWESIKNTITKANLNVVKITEPTAWFDDDTITPDRVKNAITDMKQYGKLKDILDLFEDLIDSDSNLAGNIDIRLESMKSRSVIIHTELTDKQKEYFDTINRLFFPELSDIFLNAKMKRAGFNQVKYEQVNGLWYPKQFLDYKLLDLRIEKRELVLYADEAKKTLDDIRFIRILFKRAILQPLMKYYVFAYFAINNWSSLTETYGKPWRIGKYEPGTPTPDQDTLWNMLKSMGTNMAAMFPKNVEMEFKDFMGKAASADIYQNLVTFSESKSTKRILGTTVVTESEKFGTEAKAKTAREVTKDIQRGDARDLQKFLSGFYTRLNQINFNATQAIDVEIDLTEPADLFKEIDLDVKLQNQIGIYMDDDYFYEKYDRPKPTTNPPKQQDPADIFYKSVLNRIDGLLPIMTTRGNYTPKARNMNTFRRKVLKFRDKSMRKLIKEAAKLRDQIGEMKDFDELKDLSLDTLESLYGRELKKFIEYSMKKGFLGGRKPSKRNKTNLRIIATLSAENRTLEEEIEKMLKIEWDLDSEKALEIFRDEGMEVAGVESKTLKAMILSEAEKAMKVGLTFSEWRENLILRGFEADNPYYLRTNFNTGINGAYHAGEWYDAQENSDLFPYLRYVSVLIETTREEHAELHGVIADLDDAFWDEHYPPNGWNCLCGVEQLTPDEAENDPMYGKEPPQIDIQENFRNNPGKDQTIWGDWLKGKRK